MHARALVPLALSLLLMAPGSLAQNQFDLGELEPGQLLLNLSVSEQTEVEQDMLTATLQYTVQGKDPQALQQQVNEAIAQALEILQDAQDVEYSTQYYHVFPFTPPDRPQAEEEPQELLWRAQQSVRLVSTNSAEVLALAGALQTAGLHMTDLSYSLSPQKYAEVTDALMLEALRNLQARADEAAQALNKEAASLIEVSLDNQQNAGPFDPRMARMSAADAEMAPPVASPGQSQVSVTVSARALLPAGSGQTEPGGAAQ